MKKTLNKTVSILLSLIMVFSMFTIVPLSAGAAENAFVKVTSEPTDWSGEYLVVYEVDGAPTKVFNSAANLASGANTLQAEFGVSDGNIDYDDTTAAAVVTIAKIEDTGYYSIKTASDTYIGRSDDTNGINESGSALNNTIAWDNGSVKITSAGGAIMRYNTGSSQFRYYKTATYTKQQPIQLYKLTAAEPAAPTYTVTWMNGDDVLETDTDVEENTAPSYDGETPEKAEDNDYTYTFSGWTDGTITYALTDTLPEVTGDVTYTAVFESAAKFEEGYYIFGSMNGWSRDEAYRLTPNPSNQSEYMFIGIDFNANDEFKVVGCAPGQDSVWFPGDAGNCVINDGGRYSVYFNPYYGGGDDWYYGCIYVAPVTYTVTWKLDEDTVIDSAQVAYGTVPTHADPTKDADAQFTYTFAGWDVEPVAATEDATYTATFTPTLREYTVTWKLDEDTVIDSAQVAYGETPAYDGEIPTKPEDDSNTYTFSGWDPEVVAVTGDAEYTATFTAESKALNGPQDDGYFYLDDVRLKAYQLVEYQGNWYFISDAHKYAKSERLYMSQRFVEGTDLAVGYYDFDDQGRLMIINGPQDDGYFYLNSVKLKAYQLVEYEGDYYFINDAHKYAKNMCVYLSQSFVAGTDLAVGYYEFGEDGAMIIKNGPDADGYFYLNGVRQNAYQLIEFEEKYYFINDAHKYAKNMRVYLSQSFVAGTDLAVGYYEFGEDGAMIIKNGPDADGYFYLNGARQNAYKLVKFEDNYYFINDAHKYAKSMRLYMSQSFVKDYDLAVGYYNFDADGKMVIAG